MESTITKREANTGKAKPFRITWTFVHTFGRTCGRFITRDSVKIFQQGRGIGQVGILDDRTTINVVAASLDKARMQVFDKWCVHTKKHFPCWLRELRVLGIL